MLATATRPAVSSGPLRCAELAVAALIFIVTCLIYLVSPVVTSSDAMFAMHVGASFYKGLYGDVSQWLPAIKAAHTGQDAPLPYQLATTATGLFSVYPIGTPLMVIPYVAANELMGGHLLANLEQNIAP